VDRSSCMDFLLEEFGDVFQDPPKGLPLPPITGIEHQINSILGSSLPSQQAYQTNP